MATIKKPAKKMQMGGKATADSTAYFKKRESDAYSSAARNIKDPKLSGQAFKRGLEAGKSVDRQSKKGKPGYDKNGYPLKKQEMGGVTKAKNGKSFPDLNKDGKITKADILKGRGVIAKKGASLKKQAAVAIAMKKAGKTPKTMKSGGKMKKCAYGCK